MVIRGWAAIFLLIASFTVFSIENPSAKKEYYIELEDALEVLEKKSDSEREKAYLALFPKVWLMVSMSKR